MRHFSLIILLTLTFFAAGAFGQVAPSSVEVLASWIFHTSNQMYLTKDGILTYTEKDNNGSVTAITFSPKRVSKIDFSSQFRKDGFLQIGVTTIGEEDMVVTPPNDSPSYKLGYKHFRFNVSDENVANSLAEKLQSLTGCAVKRN